MKSLLKAFGMVALSAAVAHAGTDQKDLKKVLEDQGINYVQTAQKGITLSGYVDTSYTYQFAGNGEYGTSQHSTLRQFDTSNNTFNVNAVKIAIEKALPDKNEWAAGFRIDTIYGSDARYLGDSAFQNNNITNVGGSNTVTNNSTGLALEQALVKFRVPVGNGLDFYMGKFVTFLGYEVIESPANLNFSRGLLFTNAIPLTHTGIYTDYKFNDSVEVKFGIVDGWNNSTSGSSANGTNIGVGNATAGFTTNGAKTSFGKAITGQITLTAPGKNATLANSFIYSPEGEANTVGSGNGPLVVYDIWGNWNPTFVKDNALTLGFNVDFGYNGDTNNTQQNTFAASVPPIPAAAGALPTVAGVNDTTTWYGVALYAQYKFNKVFSLAGRGEYLHEDKTGFTTAAGVTTVFPKFGNGTFAGLPASQDDFSYTLTANFNIWDNLLTRVEYRVDDLCGGTTGLNNAIQHEISLNAVYSF